METEMPTEITAQEYVDRIDAFETFLNGRLQRTNGWCSARHRYYALIIPGYHYDRESCEVTITHPTSEFGRHLSEIRRRILWYAKAGECTIEDANEGIRILGLIPYPVKQTIRVWLPTVDLQITADDTNNIYNYLFAYITAKMDGVEYDGPDLTIIPGSFRFTRGYPSDISRLRGGEVIDDSDTLYPGNADD